MKGKLLTICIVSLFLGLALIPVTGSSLPNSIARDNEKVIESEAIAQVLEKYADDTKEIQKYIETHLDPEHPELLILPDGLQEKVDTIVSELKGYRPPGSGDITLPVSGTDDEVPEKYADDIKEIQKYIETHLDPEHPELLILPDDLQEKVDTIVSELKGYRPLGSGDITLPVSGTDDDDWIGTWDNPVYMGDFHYTTSARSDVHLYYKNSNGNWIEFDRNYWKASGSFTDTINADTYGIKLGGWCRSGNDCTYTWEWYTDVNENKCYTVPTGGSDDGVTKIDFRCEWYGFQTWFYMNHDYIENSLELGLGLGIAGFALLIIALGTITMGVAWVLAGILIVWGLDAIQDCDQGRGVVVYMRNSWFWWIPSITTMWAQ